MATAVQKVASLGERRDIPFNKLILSQANVRKTKAGVSIPELAEDIGHRGLLQNLNVVCTMKTHALSISPDPPGCMAYWKLGCTVHQAASWTL